jgi:hypothetical protein
MYICAAWFSSVVSLVLSLNPSGEVALVTEFLVVSILHCEQVYWTES